MNRPRSAIRSSIAVARWENSCIYSKICCSSSTQRQNSRVKHHKKAKQLKYCLYFLLAAKKSTVIVSFRLDSSVIFENICNIDFERASRNPHFDFRSVIQILFPFPPTGRDNTAAKRMRMRQLWHFRFAQFFLVSCLFSRKFYKV